MFIVLFPGDIEAGPPADAAQIDALAAALGLELPEEYRALLAEASGFHTNIAHVYSTSVVPERNATYEVSITV